MDTVTFLLAVALIAITWLLLFGWNGHRSEFVRQVNQFPGPKSYPIVGTMLPFMFLKRNELFAYKQERLAKYPTPFRTWNGKKAFINLQKAEDFEVILKSSELIDKGPLYLFLHQWLGTGLLTSTGQKWHKRRKLITPTFHFSILDGFVDVFSEKSEILVGKLRSEVGNNGFDVYSYITNCALDIICETAMGTPIHAQEDGGSEYVKAIYGMSELTIQRSFNTLLHPNFFFKMSSLGQRTVECLKILHCFTKKIITERKAQLLSERTKSTPVQSHEEEHIGKKRRKAFLDLLLEASLDGIELTDEDLREEVDTFMFEGHDTTSAGISWAILLLGLHPDIQEEAYREQQRIFQNSQRAATTEDLFKMKYLERAIKETLRLYPSAPTISRTLKKNVKIGGLNVPAGCCVTMHIFKLHRDPKYFPEPEKFNPDNFLPERMVSRHPYAYVPFSAGPRNCIGQKFAMLEEKTVLSHILRSYKITSLVKREDIKLLSELILRPEGGIRIKIAARNGLIQ